MMSGDGGDARAGTGSATVIVLPVEHQEHLGNVGGLSELSTALLRSPNKDPNPEVRKTGGNLPRHPDETAAATVELINVEQIEYPEIDKMASLLDAGGESEHTDDELPEVGIPGGELDVVSGDNLLGEISIFEYNEEGLTRKSHLSLDGEDFAGESSEEEGEEFECRICHRVCMNWPSFRNHLKTHSGAKNTMACPLCPKTFTTKSFLERHVRALHYKEKPFICRYCGKGFSTEWYCQKHEGHHENGTGPRIAARDRKHICRFCEKEFPKLGQLRMHEATHTGEKSHSCEHCYKTFCYSSSLLKHLKSMHSDKPALCVYCNRIYCTEESLLKHQEHHIGVDQYQCRRCEEIFPDMLSLKRHGRTVHYEETERPHHCSHCEKRFSQRSMLEAHLRCHSGEKPFLCPTCGKAFRQKSQMTTHLRCHSAERPFACETCGRTFAMPGTLQRHQKTHSGDKPHVCAVCKKSFSHSASLDRHMKTHKADTTDSSNPTSQDAEILALALKSFVQSMAKAQGDKKKDGSRLAHSDEESNPSDEQVENNGGGESSPDDTAKTPELTTATITAGQALTSTKLETASGPVEILSFAIEEEIEATTTEDCSEAVVRVSEEEEAVKPDLMESVHEADRSGIGTELSINEIQPEIHPMTADATLDLEDTNDVEVNVEEKYIAQSIFENPNMERIRQKYTRKPQMVGGTNGFVPTGDPNNLEVQDALAKLSVASDTSEGGTREGGDAESQPAAGTGALNAPGRVLDPAAEDSEKTDDEMEVELDVEELAPIQGVRRVGNSKDKVYESLSIFEFSGEGLVCVRKVDMFEPKFHRKCPRCGKSFYSLAGYESHVRRHDKSNAGAKPDPPYMCQHCGRGFASKMSVRAHEASHTGDTLYKCAHCPREFRNYSSHRIHTATHLGLKPYLCRFCNKPFAQLGHVQRHERTHTGARPFACEFCDKAFAEWGTWQRHTRTHTNERPYVCPTCGKGFIVKFSLRRHMRTHEKDHHHGGRGGVGPGGGGGVGAAGIILNHSGQIGDYVSSPTEVTVLIDDQDADQVKGGGGSIVFDRGQCGADISSTERITVFIEEGIPADFRSDETSVQTEQLQAAMEERVVHLPIL